MCLFSDDNLHSNINRLYGRSFKESHTGKRKCPPVLFRIATQHFLFILMEPSIRKVNENASLCYGEKMAFKVLTALNLLIMRFIIDMQCIFLVIYVNKHELNFHGPLLSLTLFSNPFKKVSLGWQKIQNIFKMHM